MLFSSGNGLFNSTIEYISKHDSIIIYSPYIKSDVLKQLPLKNRSVQIVVRWNIKDIVQGSSDLELFRYCRQNRITLYRNTRIHLKAFWNNEESILFGSANVSGRGIAEEGIFNYELNGIYNNMSFEDRLYLQNIISESEIVDQNLFDKIRKLVEDSPKPTSDYLQLSTNKKEVDYFLLSQLPMSETPKLLYQIYSNPVAFSAEDQRYALSDLALYKVPLGMNKKKFFKYMKETFNQHPFIVSLKGHIKSTPTQSLHYGGVVSWIQNNTTTVPTPRSWELKRDLIVNILYEWICYFDNEFSWRRPNYSQVISYKKIK
ncbi:hypothetical protein [Maribellus mangrovi]|uniref:hypothetical protein n=1 Tax=Maribellus mangrovi TaxID=3133146 RepID=UPI0030EF7C80